MITCCYTLISDQSQFIWTPLTSLSELPKSWQVVVAGGSRKHLFFLVCDSGLRFSCSDYYCTKFL